METVDDLVKRNIYLMKKVNVLEDMLYSQQRYGVDQHVDIQLLQEKIDLLEKKEQK